MFYRRILEAYFSLVLVFPEPQPVSDLNPGQSDCLVNLDNLGIGIWRGEMRELRQTLNCSKTA